MNESDWWTTNSDGFSIFLPPAVTAAIDLPSPGIPPTTPYLDLADIMQKSQ